MDRASAENAYLSSVPVIGIQSDKQIINLTSRAIGRLHIERARGDWNDQLFLFCRECPGKLLPVETGKQRQN